MQRWRPAPALTLWVRHVAEAVILLFYSDLQVLQYADAIPLRRLHAHAGMILWPKAKRAVSVSTAARIAAEATQRGAQPVAVFVDEDADTIAGFCSDAGIGIAQLHGDGARASLADIPPDLQVGNCTSANSL